MDLWKANPACCRCGAGVCVTANSERRETVMNTCKELRMWAVLATVLAAGSAWAKQAVAPSNAQKTAETAPIVNPVSTAVKGQLARFSKNMVAAAEAMPPEKYNFRPTPEMNSFGHLMMHIAQSNHLFCSKISGAAAPDVKISDSDPKDKLVAAIQTSFQYFQSAMETQDESKLRD